MIYFYWQQNPRPITFEDRVLERRIAVRMKNLKDREKDIFVKRCLNDPPETLEKLSKTYNVSREIIRQIEVRSFEKVKKTVLETAIKENKENLIEEKKNNLAT